MRTLFKMQAPLIVAALWAGLTVTLSAATPIFDNSVGDLTVRLNPGKTEVGDQIMLAGAERYLTYFDFEFWGTNTASPGNVTFAGDVEARVQFYRNNGEPFNGYATPANGFYDSGWFSVGTPTERSTLIFAAGSDFPSGGLYIPADEMTWSVQFRGMGLTDTVGLDIYSPPEVGADYPDYWENNGGWKLVTNGVPMDFAARMYANVPEPSVAALSVLGGLGILTLTRRLRRNG